MNLDDKLKLLLEDHQDYWSRPERYTEPLKKGELTFIERIKRIFEADHYYKIYPQTKMVIFKQDDGTMKELRTGDQWYEGFKQFADSVHIHNNATDAEYEQSRIMQQLYKAARKASVLEDE